MWIRFLRRYDWTVPEDRRVSLDYLEGCTYNVRKHWAEEMIGKGVAVPTRAPPRKRRT
jgi:hypothetical protein